MNQVRGDFRYENRPTTRLSSGRSYGVINEYYIEPRLSYLYDGEVYLWSEPSSYWCRLVSDRSMREICDVVGASNVSVNYAIAIRPYAAFMRERSEVLESMPISTCIGFRRYTLKLELDSTLTFKEAQDMVPVAPNSSSLVSQFCYSPVTSSFVPTSVPSNIYGSISQYMEACFSDRLDYDTIKWVVGNALIDPVRKSKFLILTGPGGTGKSTMCSIITNACRGCSCNIKSKYLTSYRDAPKDSELLDIVSSRLAVCAEVDVSLKSVQLELIKSFTGTDAMDISGISTRSYASLIVASNSLYDRDIKPEWYSAALLRRTVAVNMNRSVSLLRSTACPLDMAATIEWVLECILTRMRNDNMPVSAFTVLTTLCGAKYSAVSRTIKPSTEAGPRECIAATGALAALLTTSLSELLYYTALISPYALGNWRGVEYIKGIQIVTF